MREEKREGRGKGSERRRKEKREVKMYLILFLLSSKNFLKEYLKNSRIKMSIMHLQMGMRGRGDTRKAPNSLQK